MYTGRMDTKGREKQGVSDDLKAEIQRRNHCFTEEELLQIAYTYAPTFDKRLSLLERISAIASAEISALSKAYIDYETANYNRFLNENDGFVYELCIKERHYNNLRGGGNYDKDRVFNAPKKYNIDEEKIITDTMTKFAQEFLGGQNG